MTGTGIFITEEERKGLEIEYQCSGMWLGDGTPLGDPGRRAKQFEEKYHPPKGAGIDLKTGEWILP